MRHVFRLLVLATLLFSFSVGRAFSEVIPVQHAMGEVHAFATIRSQDGAVIGSGEIWQFVDGDRITAHIVYHFHDGSLDDETAVFTQNKTIRLLSDRHIQRGPFFAKPSDLEVDANGQVTSRSITRDGRTKVEHLDVPPDLSNGIVGALLLNVHPDAPAFTVGLVVPSLGGRLIKLDIAPEGQSTFSVAGIAQKATIFRIKLELGGLVGVVAPIVGKQPSDIFVWVLEGDAPLLVREVGQLAEDSPIVSVELAGATFPKAPTPTEITQIQH
jgi:hypothetical protein